MRRIYFISETKLKEDSIINANVDVKLIEPLITECQEFYILPILGTGLYNKLQDDIQAFVSSATPIPSASKTLLDEYIIPCLVKYIQYEAPIVLNYKFTNANVSTKNTDESLPITLDEIERIMRKFKDKAEWYAQRITLFLIANMVTYPLFINPGSNADTIHPNPTNYTSGMYLGPDSNDEAQRRMYNMKTSSPN